MARTKLTMRKRGRSISPPKVLPPPIETDTDDEPIGRKLKRLSKKKFESDFSIRKFCRQTGLGSHSLLIMLLNGKRRINSINNSVMND